MYKLKIVLKSDMCAGSGESAGNSVDRDICMDDVGLPYIPARRMKGCLREAAESLKSMGYDGIGDEWINRVFGDSFGTSGSLVIENAYLYGYEELRAYLLDDSVTRYGLSRVDVIDLFSYVRGQTRLKDGVKVDNTLRFTRVLSHYNPLYPNRNKETELYALVYADEKDVDVLRTVCTATRHIGSLRNRGLGNVRLSLEEVDCKKDIRVSCYNQEAEEDTRVRIHYKVVFNAPIALQSYDEIQTAIPSRSVIGCMASQYYKSNRADSEEFKDLFLNGEVIWSDATPVIDGVRSVPTPLMFLKLKNDNNRIINRYTENDNGYTKKKPKTLEGSYATLVDQNVKITYPEVHSEYHVRLSDRDGFERMLYSVDSLNPFVIYGGFVDVPNRYQDLVVDMFKNYSLRFGKSKSAQYASCSLVSLDIKKVDEKKRDVGNGEAIFVVLDADMIIDDGFYITDNDVVRSYIAKELKINNSHPEGYDDQCRYRIISGYQTKWQMNKPHIPAVCGGSVYCFVAEDGGVPDSITVGEMQQEGFGRCSVYTIGDLKEWNTPNKISDVDILGVETSTEVSKQLEAVLLKRVSLEYIKEYAESKWSEIKNQIKGGEMKSALPIGRLRAMLNDADSIEDLRMRINDMKESDVSSEIIISRKKDCGNLINTLYGENNIEWIEQLSGLISNNWDKENVFRIIKNDWKIVLSSVLHKAHYTK